MGTLSGSPRHAPGRAYQDRRQAGQVLGDALQGYRGKPNLLVLALPRGGVPVAWEVAAALQAPLDVFVVRKLGAPRWPELAVGALASGGGVVLNDEVVCALRLDEAQLQQITDREAEELARRERAYRGGRPPLELAGKTVILVDDGVATGASMTAAVKAIRAADPAAIVVAVPVAPRSAQEPLAHLAEDVVIAATPSSFMAVGEYYCDFRQTTDDEVRELLGTPTDRIS
jgi:putative phosphoribosyl transferase